MIRALVFDADGVLVHPWRFRDALREHHGITPEMTAPFFTGPFMECITGREALLDALAPFLSEWGWKGSLHEFVELWFRAENAPNTPLLREVERLRARGVACHVASNQEALRARYMTDEMGFGQRFDELFFSAHLGVMKPHAGFFQEIVRRLGLAPSELLFFDDHPRNVEAARAQGWNAQLYEELAQFRGTVETLVDDGKLHWQA